MVLYMDLNRKNIKHVANCTGRSENELKVLLDSFEKHHGLLQIKIPYITPLYGFRYYDKESNGVIPTPRESPGPAQ